MSIFTLLTGGKPIVPDPVPVDPPASPPTEKVTTITITMTGNRIDVKGPLTDKVTFLGMIEVAKEVCFDYNDGLAVGG